MTLANCPFCEPPSDRVFYRSPLVFGMWDGYPVTPNHALLIPTRHFANWFEASITEQIALLEAIQAAKVEIEKLGPVDGFNIGINAGAAAGQTVFHLHVHLIPRRLGDVTDPRGGVRHVIPSKGFYVRDQPLAPPPAQAAPALQSLTTGQSDPLLPHLRHHLSHTQAANIAVAFAFPRGLDLLYTYFAEVLERGGSIRFLTGDYRGVTDPDALVRLLDLPGNIECRVYDTQASRSDPKLRRSFHPKVYIFDHLDGTTAAFVGSSNLSETALTSGVEWNYRVLDSRDAQGIHHIKQSFEELFHSAYTQPLTPEWISEYRTRRATPERLARVSSTETPIEPPIDIPEPHPIQSEALEQLELTRAVGHRAGLVVLATGLGKTWLSAFDSRGFKKVLFVAHREEILSQAMATFRVIRPHDHLGRYSGTAKDQSASVVFASVQTLSRQAHLHKFAPDTFDYVIVDEFHHAEARTYRKLLAYFRPAFLLGLTATPERSDGADLLALCGDNLVYRCDMPKGIDAGLLCPFRYFGVPDTVDYRNIPWRNRKFDDAQLTEAVATQARAANILDQYQKRAGKRTIAFCVSQRHADFMRDYLIANGITARSVHAGVTSDPRAESLELLKLGQLPVLCAVDMFNEGVDVPDLDTVMMLRPTESRILWLQQFGRGLRRSDAAKRLTVIDYIGNHRSFLLKPQALFGLSGNDAELATLLSRLEKGEAVLPAGCEVTYDLEVKNIFQALLQKSTGAYELVRKRYEDFQELIGIRPTAVELLRERFDPKAVRKVHASWLDFVRSQQGLSEQELQAYTHLKAFLDLLDTTPMTKSFKMATLLALLNLDLFPGTVSIDALLDEVRRIANSHARIADDIGEALDSQQSLKKLWVSMPIAAWVGGKGTGGISYFAADESSFTSTLSIPSALRQAAQDLVRELVDWRLEEYFFTRSHEAIDQEYALKVIRSGENPILILPDRDTHQGLPEGWTNLRINNSPLSGNFVKIALNVVRDATSDMNRLPEILRGWFGADAGKPGTSSQVILRRQDDAWELAPQEVRSGQAVLYKAYIRADIPGLFGLKHSEFWRQGFIRQGQNTFLLVTLDKSGHDAAFQYQDKFLSSTEFQWQSQNQTTQAGKAGESIRDHAKLGIQVLLFVRKRGKTAEGKGAPFHYLGPVNFHSWKGEKPITVQWTMEFPVPKLLWPELEIDR